LTSFRTSLNYLGHRRALGKLAENGKAAIQRKAGAHKGVQCLRENQKILAPHSFSLPRPFDFAG
jgi:hypothetical protein